jgi:hypothetical protein
MQQNALAAQKIVTNVRFAQSNFRARQQRTPMQTEHYDVLENEILVFQKNQRVINNHRLPRLQSWWSRDASDAEPDNYSFYGIAVTPHTASVKYMIDQGFVACIAGICKAVNESENTIHVGELLTYEVNCRDVKQRGVPRNKCRFSFAKYDATNTSHRKRGIVAKALSNAKQHSPYDVLLFPRGNVHNEYSLKKQFEDIPDKAEQITKLAKMRKAFDAAHGIV